METFCLKPTIYFGADALSALERLAGKRVLVVTDGFLVKSGLLDRVTAHLKGGQVEVFDQVVPDPPLALVAQGVRVLARRTNVLGEVTDRCRLTLVLRLTLPFVPGDAALAAENAARLLALQSWAAAESAAHRAPVFGNTDTEREVLRAEQGRIERADAGGTVVYTVRLQADYTQSFTEELQ